MFTQDDKINCIMTKPVKKTDAKEIGTEYTLPDYLPDITRLLRVSARVENPEKYCSGDTVEYDGKLCFSVVYATSDGEIKNAMFDTDYSGTVTGQDIDDLSVVDVDTYTENVSCRLSSPRKLTVKTKVITNISICGMQCAQPAIGGRSTAESAKSLQYRKQRVEFMQEIKAQEKNTPISEDIEIEPGMPQISEIVFVTLTPEVNDVRCTDGKVNYNGAILANIMYEAQGSEGAREYISFEREIPVSGSVDADGAVEGASAICDINVTNISYRPQADELGDTKTVEVDFDYSAYFRIFCKSECEVTTDMYSLDFENSNEKETVRYRTVDASKVFNFSFNENAPYDDEEFTRVISVQAGADVTSVEKAGTKAIVEGNISFSAIMGSEAGTYAGKNFTLPFKAETDIGKYSELFAHTERVCVDSVSARVTDGKMFFDAEITVNLSLFGEKEVDALKTCTVFTDRPIVCQTHANVVLYYPMRGDDLWNVAKKYNTTVEKLAALNGIGKDSLDGGVLVIPTRKR